MTGPIPETQAQRNGRNGGLATQAAKAAAPAADAVTVPVRELRIFRKIIEREARIVLASFASPGQKVLSDSSPKFVVREYLEMQRALEKLNGYLAGAEKGGRK